MSRYLKLSSKNYSLYRIESSKNIDFPEAIYSDIISEKVLCNYCGRSTAFQEKELRLDLNRCKADYYKTYVFSFINIVSENLRGILENHKLDGIEYKRIHKSKGTAYYDNFFQLVVRNLAPSIVPPTTILQEMFCTQCGEYYSKGIELDRSSRAMRIYFDSKEFNPDIGIMCTKETFGYQKYLRLVTFTIITSKLYSILKSNRVKGVIYDPQYLDTETDVLY